MDPLPLVPRNEDHDVLHLFRAAFQDVLRGPQYPRNIADNYQKYEVDMEFQFLQQTGRKTIKILEALETSKFAITKVEKDIMDSHAQAIIRKRNYQPYLQEIQMKKLGLFDQLSSRARETYGLIAKRDIFPNIIEQYLDFTYNPCLHSCAKLCHHKKHVPSEPVKKVKRTHQGPPCDEPPKPPFRAEPDKILFHNYELKTPYKKKFKLRNITDSPQFFHLVLLSKDSPYRVTMLTNSCRVAPGMFAEFLVSFQTPSYKDGQETIQFKSAVGVDITVEVTNTRQCPKLVCYVFNPFLPWSTVNKPGPGSRYFLDRRQNALNFTIDCGTCLLGSYVLISVILKNAGTTGRFFIATENEWVFSEIYDRATRTVELIQDVFVIFPTFFELEPGEIGQVFVLFAPDRLGVCTEKLYLLCDNNSVQELELLGDCTSFSNSFLKVNLYLLEDTFRYVGRKLEISLPPRHQTSFLFSVINDSPICMEYYLALLTDIQEGPHKKMTADWINVQFNTRYLPSFSTTDVVVQLAPRTEEEGTYYIHLSLCLKNIPIESITGGTYLKYGHDNKCVFLPLEQKEAGNSEAPQLVHVLIFDLEIFCTVKTPEVVPAERVSERKEEPQSLRRRNLVLSSTSVHFGDIPKGVKVSKSFYIRNLSAEKMNWKILEIYPYDSNVFMQSDGKCLSRSRGTLKGNSTKKIVYTVEAEECLYRLAILILFSCIYCNCEEPVAEAVCVVTYHISEIKVSIKASNNKSILSPSFVYVGLPSQHKIYVQNEGLVTGCFYFLKPTGTNSDKIRLKFKPHSSEVPPGTTIEVTVEIVALESGIFEDIVVPCFTGDPDRLVSLRIILPVATINTYFYLPIEKGFKKVLWPPNNDRVTWGSGSNVGEDDQNDEGEWGTFPSQTVIPDGALMSLIAADSVAATYPTVRAKAVPVKTPFKLTFYMENLTPIHGRYLVTPTNYSPEEECFNNILVKARTRPREFFWEKACSDGDGIVIETEGPSGDIVPYEVVAVTLWIYANTWGRYLEEIIVEVNDLTPFCFNLVVDVVGLPLEFPFARNTTLPAPTLRFGHMPYSTENHLKTFTVTNRSAVPLQLSWHVFTPIPCHHDHLFNVLLQFEGDTPTVTIPKHFYGNEACVKCISVDPSELTLDKQATASVSVRVSATGYAPICEKTQLEFDLVGFIDLSSNDKFKENYYRREYGLDAPGARIKVLGTLEMPIMQVDLSCDETVMDVFVNDVLLRNREFPETYVLLRNVDKSIVRFKMEIDKPFKISEARTVPTGILDLQNIALKRHECLQIKINCHLSYDELLKFADIIYQKPNNEDCANINNFVSTISRNLNVFQEGMNTQVRLHFPHIQIKPRFIKFPPCLLYRTRKTIFSIYNMTACLVKFEIYKTTRTEDIEVFPNVGEIPGSTGLNKQFVDIALYFTPRRCKLYVERLRITTNIHQYYIDLPVSGAGSNNEKFNPD